MLGAEAAGDRRGWAIPSSTPAAAPTAWNDERFFHATMAVVAALLAAVSAYGLYATRMTLALGPVVAKAAVLVLCLTGAVRYRTIRSQRLFDLFAVTFWGLLFNTLHLLPMFIAARQRVELSDALLARLDRLMGVEAPQILVPLHSHPTLKSLLDVWYPALLPMLAAAMILPPLCGRMRAAKQFAFGCVVAAMIAIPLFGLFQALGPWIHYGYTPAIDQDAYVRTFQALKTQDRFVLDVGYRDGLICFPSFHTILAVLSAAALWTIPYVRWGAAAISTLIVVSTITTGTHYVIDVVAGLVVAWVALLAARGYSRLEARWARGSERERGAKEDEPAEQLAHHDR